MYDLVIVAESEKQLARAFADAFVGRDRRERVAVVLPANQNLHPELHRLQRSLELSEIIIIEGRCVSFSRRFPVLLSENYGADARSPSQPVGA